MKPSFALGLASFFLFASSAPCTAANWDSAFQADFTTEFYSDWGAGGKALASYGTTVYGVVMYHTCCDTRNFLAKWTASAGWQPLPNSDVQLGLQAGKINCIAATATDLYIGGSFTSAGHVPIAANNVARYNLASSSYSAMGPGLTGTSTLFGPSVRAIHIVSGGNVPFGVYAGGDFLQSSTTVLNNITYWNGSSWQPMGAGSSGSPTVGVKVFGDPTTTGGPGVKTIWGEEQYFASMGYYHKIYIGGSFQRSSGSTTNYNFEAWNSVYNFFSHPGSTGYTGPTYYNYTEGQGYCTYEEAWMPWISTVSDIVPFGSDKLILGGHFRRVNSLFQLGEPAGCVPTVKPLNLIVYSRGGGSYQYLTDLSGNRAYWGAGTAGLQLAVNGSNLYVGGNAPYPVDSSLTTDLLYKWNTSTGWENLGLGQTGRPIQNLLDIIYSNSSVLGLGYYDSDWHYFGAHRWIP